MPLYNNSMSMRGALGITRSGSDVTGRAYDLTSRGQFMGFGELKTDPAAPLAAYYGRTDDSWDQWMNAAARTWANVTGNTEEAIKFRNRGVQLNDAFGTKGYTSSCSTLFTALPNDPNDCNDIPCQGLICRGLPANFHPCESVVRAGPLKAAEKCGKNAADFVQTLTSNPATENASAAQEQASATPPMGTQDLRTMLMSTIRQGGFDPTLRAELRASAVNKWSALRDRIPDTSKDVLGVEEKSNTPLIVGGIAVAAVAFFLLKK